MKHILLVTVALAAQFAFAGPGVEVKRLSIEAARSQVESKQIYKDIKEITDKAIRDKKDPSKSLMENAQIKSRIVKAVELTTKDAATVSTTEQMKIVQLISISPLDVMTHLSHLASIAKSTGATPAEKASVQRAVSLFLKAADTIDLMVDQKSSSSSNKVQEQIKMALEISEKIATLKVGDKSQKNLEAFVEKYENALRENKTMEEAVKIASGGKFSLKDLLDCLG